MSAVDPGTRSWRAYAWTEEERDQEEDGQEGHVPDDRTERDDGDSEQSRLDDSANGERLDEQVTNDKDDGEAEGTNDFTDNNRLPRCSRHIARQLIISIWRR
jgi:hypothetical protein